MNKWLLSSLFIIFSIGFFIPQQCYSESSLSTQLNKRCVNQYSVKFTDGSIKKILFDDLPGLELMNNVFLKILTEEVSSLNCNNDNLKIHIVQTLATDSPELVIIIIDDKYGLFLSLYKRDNSLAFNLLINGCLLIELSTKKQVKQYLDFYLRMGSNFYLGFYRISAYKDIWLYPQFFQYQKNLLKDFEVQINKIFNELLLLENMSEAKKIIKYELTEYPKYLQHKKTLSKQIKPIVISKSNDTFLVTTFIADVYKGDIERWELAIRTDGRIESIEKEKIAKKVGFKQFLVWETEPNY